MFGTDLVTFTEEILNGKLHFLPCNLHATRTTEANQVGEESGCVRTLAYQQYQEQVFQINMEK